MEAGPLASGGFLCSEFHHFRRAEALCNQKSANSFHGIALKISIQLGTLLMKSGRVLIRACNRSRIGFAE